jgi:hypothetical protein
MAMTEIAGGDLASSPGGQPPSRIAGRKRAAGIYGTIITAAVIAAAGGTLAPLALAVAVLGTLIVYWIAEQYADVLGEQIEHGHRPSWSRIGHGMANTWPMVSAAYIPVLALLVARLFKASNTVAANLALSVAVLLLVIHGWVAGRAAGLRGAPLLVTTLIAGSLGVLMIILKNFAVTHLH